MEKEDARYQKLKQLHERRKQVVRLHRKGYGVMAIVELTGLSYPAARLAIDLYEEGGAAALKPCPRARTPGDGRRLNADQEEAIRRTICDKRPEQLKMESALWTRGAVMLFIEQEYAFRLSIRAVGDYLKRWGFTPKKPIKRAYEQRPEAVKQWIDQEYPAIEKRAKAKGGEIHWGDETALVNTDVRGRSYAPKGQTPVTMTVRGTRQKLSMISTVTNQGKASWMIIDGAFNHEKLIEFFEALVADGKRAGKKVFLILDNLGVHHCKPVKAWLAEHQADIEVFYLPSYSPELNLDERLNADLKHVISTRVPVRTKAKLHAAAKNHMAFIETHPERVKSYFQDPRVKYAA
ncbi:MAG: IS630 family transposase [Candidatus Protistobacter heckmanni]|nr:IS630 family transposase [Candidatus Protistobacter heckmanni]